MGRTTTIVGSTGCCSSLDRRSRNERKNTVSCFYRFSKFSLKEEGGHGAACDCPPSSFIFRKKKKPMGEHTSSSTIAQAVML
jgi:hypothetical protein